jgi:hydroxymethylglutaryl-CoA lyase
MSLPTHVRIFEVGPRDGLQNEPETLPAATKVEFIDRLSVTGLSNIESGSFVSPKWVPQMANSAEVMTGIERRPGVSYSVLVPNMRGFEQALAVGAEEIAIFAAASETFSKRNINCSIDESIERFKTVAEAANRKGVRMRGYISCTLGCPFEGAIEPAAVAAVAVSLADLGCYEVSLGDTIGVGTPLKSQAMVNEVAAVIPVPKLALHFHDTYGQALANVLACLELGISVVDSSTSGLGGCPYAPGATGNVATEDVVFMLDGMGIQTGVDLAGVAAAGQFICDALKILPASKVARALGSLTH